MALPGTGQRWACPAGAQSVPEGPGPSVLHSRPTGGSDRLVPQDAPLSAGLGCSERRLSLLASSLGWALLCRFGAQQARQDAGLRPTPLHLEVGPQGRVLPRAPVGGGHRIWKEGRGAT